MCAIFNGQPNKSASFTIENTSPQREIKELSELFTMWGNHEIELSDSQILANLQSVQHDNGLKESDSLAGNIFTIEMETGTGKTYTYIKTIHELHKLYGWSKFIIVVPSIAIREGIFKTFEMTESHFMANSDYTRADYFIYDSANLSKINAFASDSGLKIMIINSQAFNARGQDARRIRMELDEFRSRKPLEVIAGVRPVLIIDEPQSVEGQKTKESLQEFNPLFTLRYSATPREYYNLVYKLDAVDAYKQKLVKRIKVTGISLGNISASGSYVYLRGIIKSKRDPVAQVEFDRRTSSGELKRVTKTLREGSDLYKESGELDEYKSGFIIKTIDGLNGTIEFLNGSLLNSGEVSGLLDDNELRRIQIRETIQAHLEKERQLYSMGVKVLSLFFIDEVSHYRKYNDDDDDDEDSSTNGIFAKMFEEEYNEAVRNFQLEINDSGYAGYLASIEASRTHAGYFSIDKKNHVVNSKDNDTSAFDLIMKDKERLLSLGEPVRFIFSHSALREGWDNPNVFQICTLKNSTSDIRRRQEVGRGLRLSVNQDGDRMDESLIGADVQEVNELNVIASESYKTFSAGLQQEIAESLPDYKGQVVIRNARDRGVRVKLDESKLSSPEFMELWRRINHRSVYSVDFNEDDFINESARDMDENLRVPQIVVNIETGTLKDDLTFETKGVKAKMLRNPGKSISYDLVGRLSKNTGLTRKVIVKILKKIERVKFSLFSVNPEVFISQATEIIKRNKAEFSSREIKYIPIENESYSAKIFGDLTLREISPDSLEDTHRTGLYDYAVCDSQVEKNFARDLDSSDDVALHVKLPNSFTITTPAGKYNPDWAVTFKGDRNIYFVAETKGSTDTFQLKGSELAKIRCAREHFRALSQDTSYQVVAGFQDLINSRFSQ